MVQKMSTGHQNMAQNSLIAKDISKTLLRVTSRIDGTGMATVQSRAINRDIYSLWSVKNKAGSSHGAPLHTGRRCC